MAADKLHIHKEVNLDNGRLLIGLSGWMDGCDISTGTVEYLIDKLGARKAAEIEPEGFYIYNFPGSMEMSALFRPHTQIKEGLIRSYDEPTNTFYCDEKHNLVLFLGSEPNLLWHQYAEGIFSFCRRFGVKAIYFVGSVAGLVPHTRQPRIFCSVSDAKLKDVLEQRGVKFSNYEGPSSIITYLTAEAKQRGLEMVSLVAEVPVYVQGRNPRCLDAVMRRLTAILDLNINHDDLRTVGDDFEKKVTELVAAQPELATHISRLEEDYDNEVFDTEMGDLKEWLQQQAIRVD